MKEQFEWIHSWCDEALKDDLPRVLLVGDSITHNYQEKVRELLRGICYVDYISTAYSIDMKIYKHLVYDFMMDSSYDLIHFNNGLHGIHISKRSYKSHLEKLLAKVEKDTRLVLATSTLVYREGNKRFDGEWMKRVRERNAVMKELVEAKGYGLDDLYPVSVAIPKEYRYVDGTHYLPNGYNMLAETVAQCIREELGK